MTLSISVRSLASLVLLAFACHATISRAQESLVPETPIPAAFAASDSIPFGDTPPPAPAFNMTLRDRFKLECKLTFNAGDFVVPAVEAGAIQEFPPNGYPPNWHEGIGGFMRNYAAEFALTSTAGIGRFTADAVLRHDPRYYPSTSPRYPVRFLHALAFTLADRTDSGHRSFAFGNLTGSAASGYVSMAIYPHGFNDFTHAYQRFTLAYVTFAGHNLFAEFAPEAIRVAHFFHLPDSIANQLLPPDRKEP